MLSEMEQWYLDGIVAYNLARSPGETRSAKEIFEELQETHRVKVDRRNA